MAITMPVTNRARQENSTQDHRHGGAPLLFPCKSRFTSREYYCSSDSRRLARTHRCCNQFSYKRPHIPSPPRGPRELRHRLKTAGALRPIRSHIAPPHVRIRRRPCTGRTVWLFCVVSRNLLWPTLVALAGNGGGPR